MLAQPANQRFEARLRPALSRVGSPGTSEGASIAQAELAPFDPSVVGVLEPLNFCRDSDAGTNWLATSQADHIPVLQKFFRISLPLPDSGCACLVKSAETLLA